MTPYTTLNNINEIIQKLYVKESVSSFFPECHKISKGAFTYGNKKLINKNPVQIDKNKAYSSILKNLDYLIITDIKTMKHGKPTKKINIQDHYLYIVEPEKSSILLNDEQICIGKKLKLCDKHNIKYKVKEVLECTYKTNYYKKMVEDLYEICDNKPQVENKEQPIDRKSTRLNSSHLVISYAVFCLKKKTTTKEKNTRQTYYCTNTLHMNKQY